MAESDFLARAARIKPEIIRLFGLVTMAYDSMCEIVGNQRKRHRCQAYKRHRCQAYTVVKSR